jgi:aminopeptidase N
MCERISAIFFRFLMVPILVFGAYAHTEANAQVNIRNFGEDPSISESQARIAAASMYRAVAVPQQDLDVTSMDLDITIDTDLGTIDALIIKRIHVSKAVAFIRLELSDALEITYIRDISGSAIPFDRIEYQQIIIAPLGGFSQGDHTLRIHYTGKPVTTGLGSINFSTRNDYPIVWTLSQPFGARDWYPTTNDPTDKIDSLLMRITVPKPLMAISNGLMLSEIDHGDRTTYSWKHRYPISPYLVSMAIADYEVFTLPYESATGDIFPIDNYVYKGQDLPALKRDAQQTIGLMNLFWELYGPYPFRKERYGHAQFGWSVGGMEHQTISSMGNLGFFLVAHELAHQWFGNKVTNATWSDLWIQEGLATLSEGLPLRYFLGEDDFRNWLRVRREQVLAQPDGSVYIPEAVISDDNLNRLFDSRLTYRKAAWVLNMLRVHVGDNDFFAGLRSYLDSYAYTSASTDDFRRTMEAASGKPLTRFFDQWVYGEGYPMLSIRYGLAVGSPSALRLDIRHVGTHSSVPTFEFPLDVRFSSVNRDTVITVQVTRGEESFVLEPGFGWTNIEIDPHVNLLFRQESLTSIDDNRPALPAAFVLEPGYPNPFNPTSYIPIRIARSGELTVDVIDLQGRIVQRLLKAVVQPGPQRILWDATGLSTGMYVIRARMAGETQTVKMTVLR